MLGGDLKIPVNLLQVLETNRYITVDPMHLSDANRDISVDMLHVSYTDRNIRIVSVDSPDSTVTFRVVSEG